MTDQRRSMRGRLAPMLKGLASRAGVYTILRKARPNRGLAILRYHAVCEPATCPYASPGICLSVEDFTAHVAHLSSHYHVLPLPDVADALRTGRSLPPNVVVFTFDDGYADNLEAARILHRHGATGTFYITAGCMSGDAPFWPAEIRQLIDAAPAPGVSVELAGRRVDLPLTTRAERNAAIGLLNKACKGHPIPVRDRLRESLRAAVGVTPPSPMLTWDGVRELHRLGMTIGAHTVSHANLPSAGLDDATKEIVGAKARLEREIDAPVTMFSYPNGGAERYYTPDIQRVVADAGYACATTSTNGFATSRSDLYALERIQIANRLEDLLFRLEVERFAFKPAPRGGEW